MPRPKPANAIAGPTPRIGPVFRHSWIFLVVLVTLLGLRAVFYHQFGPGLDWIPSLDLLNESPHFRSDHFPRALAYSVLSFGRWLVALYFCLALLSTVHPKSDDSSQWPKFLKAQFGRIGNWPVAMHWLTTLALAVGVHFGELEWMKTIGVLSQPADIPRLLPILIVLDLQAMVHLTLLLLALYLLNSYVYFGEQNFWRNVDKSGGRLLMPLRPIRMVVGKIDFAPVLALGIVYCINLLLHQEQLAKWVSALT
ncbi:MAG: hypothetical protein QF685_10895 [Verrucomicrobiota bacterium]|nr:hypothetical protein [Verrucomicrobiota bacterium]